MTISFLVAHVNDSGQYNAATVSAGDRFTAGLQGVAEFALDAGKGGEPDTCWTAHATAIANETAAAPGAIRLQRRRPNINPSVPQPGLQGRWPFSQHIEERIMKLTLASRIAFSTGSAAVLSALIIGVSTPQEPNTLPSSIQASSSAATKTTLKARPTLRMSRAEGLVQADRQA